MKLSIAKQSFREGVMNIFRHPVVTLASISTIALMLLLLGSFIIFSANANQIASNISQKPPVLLWVDYNASIKIVNDIEQILKSDNTIKSYKKQSSEENFEQFKNDLGNDSQVLEGFDPALLPYTFTIQLNDIAMTNDFKTRMEGVPGVRKVEYSQIVTQFLDSTRAAVNLATLIAFVVLCGISLFIISNMVRIVVYSRAEEIGIMKYVGATNWYIRVPFIVEGSLVGFIGSVIANIIVLLTYSILFKSILDGQTDISLFKMVPLVDVSKMVIFINTLLGVIVGGVGSAISVRRHVKV